MNHLNIIPSSTACKKVERRWVKRWVLNCHVICYLLYQLFIEKSNTPAVPLPLKLLKQLPPSSAHKAIKRKCTRLLCNSGGEIFSFSLCFLACKLFNYKSSLCCHLCSLPDYETSKYHAFPTCKETKRRRRWFGCSRWDLFHLGMFFGLNWKFHLLSHLCSLPDSGTIQTSCRTVWVTRI